ncbi:Rne/Rng family ribonuclease [Oecophyllibacter saccharovorans]|uniref:Rne/Rng family ribonuclease n=1 Tax=Oecophyllibacter saccharovorans TaxID=2558360 RepID=UPI00114311F6|nr:ribonuclease E/G [Oecophyllibacter saccharovorans]QDH15610.1 Rne/Rng family ribonuclease [Oecophyllibacter saccharovorans]
MTKHMLIDATHDEETRVVVMNGRRIEEYDIETSARRQLKGNIYLAKVIRIEPSLQAAFVEYGGNRHGFLPFSEIHPDYFQIPIADRAKLLELQEEEYAAEQQALEAGDGESPGPERASRGDRNDRDDERPETVSGENDTGEDNTAARRTARFLRNYQIQEVIRRRQILLVQVTKEERGNKGAALSTYISLPGRYCVLMPNALRGGGVSRKITSESDRRRLRDIITGLNLPPSMAMIVRTAGGGRPGPEVTRDCDYLLQLWDDIRSRALTAIAPALVYEEANIIKRAIRDLYTRDIDDIIVDSEEAWENTREFTRQLMPHNTNKVKLWQNRGQSLFARYNVENHLEAMVAPTVQLESGGYIVINQTEALVAIDVNSGKSTSQRNIEETALRTNLEAAEEIARQLRLRDLAGLVVIDFIDMESRKHNGQVEKRLKEALRHDRARIQVGKISHFGLLEMSRQRLRPSLAETMLSPCPQCHGTGQVRGTESAVLHVLRAIEETGAAAKHPAAITVLVAPEIALYILNSKRDSLAEIEERCGMKITFEADKSLSGMDFKIVPDEEAGQVTNVRSQNPGYGQGYGRGAEHKHNGRERREGNGPVHQGPQPRIIDIEEADAPFIGREGEEEIVIPGRRGSRGGAGNAHSAGEASAVDNGTAENGDGGRRSKRRRNRRERPAREGAEREAVAPGLGVQSAPEAVAEPESRAQNQGQGNTRRRERPDSQERAPREAAPKAQPQRNRRRQAAPEEEITVPRSAAPAPEPHASESEAQLMPGRKRTRLRRRADEEAPQAHAARETREAPAYRGPTPADPFGSGVYDIHDVFDTADASPVRRGEPAPVHETRVAEEPTPEPVKTPAPKTPARRTRTRRKAAAEVQPEAQPETIAEVAEAPQVHAPAAETSPVEEAPRKRQRTRKAAPKVEAEAETGTEAPAPKAPRARGSSARAGAAKTGPAKTGAEKAATGENQAAPKPIDVDEVQPAKRRAGWWSR